jgi:kanamycin kinase
MAGPPSGNIDPPEAVRRLASGATVRLVWLNAVGGVTFELAGAHARRFVKWAPHGSGLDLPAEAARLLWAGAYTPVPRPVDQGADAQGAWLVTEAIEGASAVLDRWRTQPHRAVAAVGEGLRALHEALPVRSCPFSWSAEERLTETRRRAARGHLDPSHWHDEFRELSAKEALEVLADIPPIDRLVVCHGDACCPNTLIGPGGRWAGHVDLGQLGIADRWADLAVATWSANWNYGPECESALLDAYGIDPDPERICYYRLMWDLGP